MEFMAWDWDSVGCVCGCGWVGGIEGAVGYGWGGDVVMFELAEVKVLYADADAAVVLG